MNPKIFLFLFQSLTLLWAEPLPKDPMMGALRMSHSFFGDAAGNLVIDKDETGKITGTYSFPGEAFGLTSANWMQWPLEDLKLEQQGETLTIGYRVPLDLVGSKEPIHVAFHGKVPHQGLAHLSSDDGELHCVYSGMRLACVADMSPRMSKAKLDLNDILKTLEESHGKQLSLEVPSALLPSINFRHHENRNKQNGMLVKIESWLLGGNDHSFLVRLVLTDTSDPAYKVISEESFEAQSDVSVRDITLFFPYAKLGTEIDKKVLERLRVRVSLVDVTEAGNPEVLVQSSELEILSEGGELLFR